MTIYRMNRSKVEKRISNNCTVYSIESLIKNVKYGVDETDFAMILEDAKYTNDIKYKVQSALKQKERDENFEELFGQVKIYGVKQNTKISVYSNGYEVLQSINLNKLPESFDFKKQDPTKCILTRDNYNGYNAYIVIKKSDMFHRQECKM